MSTSRVVINEASCYHAQPSKVLDIGVVGDLAFLSICDNDELDHDTIKTVIREEIMVDVNSLYEALRLLSNHQARADTRRSSVEEKLCCDDH